MNTISLTPTNSLETSLVLAQAGKLPMADFLRMLVESELYIASVDEVAEGAEGLYPLIFDREGIAMAAVFTSSTLPSITNFQYKSLVKLKGEIIFSNTPPGCGIVINPSFDTGLEFLPEGVKNIKENYCNYLP